MCVPAYCNGVYNYHLIYHTLEASVKRLFLNDRVYKTVRSAWYAFLFSCFSFPPVSLPVPCFYLYIASLRICLGIALNSCPFNQLTSSTNQAPAVHFDSLDRSFPRAVLTLLLRPIQFITHDVRHAEETLCFRARPRRLPAELLTRSAANSLARLSCSHNRQHTAANSSV